jgi:uracil phosphoribosyltransferase
VNSDGLHVVRHPAVADRLARLRDAATPTAAFRAITEELGAFLAYEATRDLALRDDVVQTPLAPARVQRFAEPPVVAPVLRAGLGLLPGFLGVVPSAVVAHLGFYRDPQSLAAIPYYANVPLDLVGRRVFVLDPMLATGHSLIAALSKLAEFGARDMTVICTIAAEPGAAALLDAHPGTTIYTGALDESLDGHGYIVPGLGDAGDRLFGSTTSVPTSVKPV